MFNLIKYLSIIAISFSQETITFTNCGQEGRYGPSQEQCDSEYGEGLVTVNGGIQEWTVPYGGLYAIEVWGASGGDKPDTYNAIGGSGARMVSEFQLEKNTILKILVGQEGGAPTGANSSGGSGGGGGSFVFFNSTNDFPLIVAGGGGGLGAGNALRENGLHGLVTTAGGSNETADGGENGYGGSASDPSYNSGGGSGWLSDGENGSSPVLSGGGMAPRNDGIGGEHGRASYSADGGFGGGGGTNDGGGGGGGYSGGAGGQWTPLTPGGGGGSFTAEDGVLLLAESGINEGHGQVHITLFEQASVSGCTDDSACNYDSEANEDDGSCLENDCAGECGGTAELDDCAVCNGSCGNPCDSHDDCYGENSVGPNWCYSNGDGDPYCVQADWDFCVNNDCYEGDGDCDCGGDCSVPGADQEECVGNLECVQYADDGGIGTDIDICECTVGYDCAGVCGGSAALDECGVCDGDNSTCADCAGVPNGDAELDNCNTCDADASNDCVQDCAGTWGGDATESAYYPDNDEDGLGWGSDIQPDYALNLDGDVDYVFLGEGDNLFGIGTKQTVSARIMLSGDEHSYQTIIDAGSISSGGHNYNAGFRIYVDSSGKLQAFYGLNWPSGQSTIISNGTLPLNEWVDVTATRDGRFTKLYINGELDAEMEMAAHLGGNIDWNGEVYDNDINAIGSYSHSTNDYTTHHYNGQIASVQIFNVELSQEEINNYIDDFGIIGDGLVGRWDFNEEGATTVTDLSSNGLDGQLGGDAAIVELSPSYTMFCEGDVPSGWVSNNNDSDDDCYSNIHDCAGDCGGSAVADCAGVCDGDSVLSGCDNACNSTAVEDCAGVCDGISVVDDCGTCDADASNDCVQDCAGTWGGEAVLDSCEDCSGGSTGLTVDYNDPDEDTVCNSGAANGNEDNCPNTANMEQSNFDQDGSGDACDPDDDNDGAEDNVDSDDNNPNVCSDDDGDQCDDCSSGAYDIASDGSDLDQDGICDVGDQCPGGDDRNDSDGDGAPNDCDVDIALQHQNSLVSFWALPEDASLSNMISNHDCDFQAVIGEGVASAMDPQTMEWFGSVQELHCDLGYWVKRGNDNPCEYNIIGDELEGNYCSEYDEEIVYTFDEYAKLISYPYSIIQDISGIQNLCESGYLNGIISEGIAATCDNGSFYGSLADFVPGEGYWFKSEGSGDEFSYPVPSDDGLTRIAKEMPIVPDQFTFNQSTRQAFYFVENIELLYSSIEVGDWLIAYNKNEIVGARMWMGELTDIPVMGFDSEYNTLNYCDTGDTPHFKVFKTQTGELLTLSQETIPAWNDFGMYTIELSEKLVPKSFSLDRAYPNPFNPVTAINFALPIESKVLLEVYDINGRITKVLTDNILESGYHSVVWNADGQASGMYFVKLHAGDFLKTQKIMLVK
jgi:hypothetical protein